MINIKTAVIVAVALMLLTISSAAIVLRTLGSGLEAKALEQAREAPETARLYLARYPEKSAMREIYQHLSRDGLRVWVADIQHHVSYPANHGPGLGDAPPGPPPARYEIAHLIATLSGASPHVTRVASLLIRIEPDPDVVDAWFRNVSIAFGTVFLFGAAGLWWYVASLKREALRPLEETTESLKRLARRDFTKRKIITGDRNALGRLASAYNEAVEAVAGAFEERRTAELEMQRFIADASHELRTPLTIVMGYLELFDGELPLEPSVGKRAFQGMSTEANRMRRLIDNLIVLARMETPDREPRLERIDAATLVADAVAKFEGLEGHRIAVEASIDASLYGDEDELADALGNLIENALKYAPVSKVRVKIAPCHPFLEISVSDDGPGLNAEEQRNAFERFYRGERRGQVPGSGLGLAIAKRAAERSGASIAIVSYPGHGTLCTLRFPAWQRNVNARADLQLIAGGRS